MKQKILCSIIICVVLIGSVCEGQVVQSGNCFVAPFANTIVQHTGSGSSNASSCYPTFVNNTGINRIAWIEYGDGGFSSNGYSTRNLASSTSNSNWFFVSSRLYDGTRDQLRINTGGPFAATQARTNPSDNDASLLTGQSKILITPNATDIISNDTMCFAVTYKFKPGAERCYYIIFNYNSNNNSVFFPMACNSINPISIPDPTNTNVFNNTPNNPTSIKYARKFHGEGYFNLQNPNIASNIRNYVASQIAGFYSNFTIMKIICNDTTALAERNIFFSLVSRDSLAEGNITSINATLIETTSNSTPVSIVDQHTLAGMAVRPAHDPNYIVQTPVCLQLPKAPRLFQYHLHFQNTGPGEADSVKIKLQFTPGFDFNTFNIARARFSDENYYNNVNNGITYSTNPTLNQIELKMGLHGDRNLNNPLAGTSSVLNPWTSQETMGDIYFGMQATAAVPYFITSQASIKFHSLQASPQHWEDPVITNTAVSVYSSCCDCSLFNCGNTKDSTNKIKKPIPVRKNK